MAYNDPVLVTTGDLYAASQHNRDVVDNIKFLYNLALVPRVVAITSSSTPTPNVDVTDLYEITALAANATFGAPTGTPVDGQRIIIRIKDNGTARTLAWNAVYVPGGVALPTTTVLSKILHVGFMYNTNNALNKWMCLAVAQEA